MTRRTVADTTFGERAAEAREALAAEAEAAGWAPGRTRPSIRLHRAARALADGASDPAIEPAIAAALAEEAALAASLHGEGATTRPWRTTLAVHGFDQLTLHDRVQALRGPTPRLGAPVLAALALRDGWDPFAPDTGAACEVGRDLGALVDAALDASAGRRPAIRVPERLARLAERFGGLHAEALAELGAPWSRASIQLRMALEHRYGGPRALVEDSVLLPAMFAAGARLFQPTEADTWTAELFEATLTGVDAADRRAVLAGDALALAFALGRCLPRIRAGHAWIAPWDPAWPVSHPADRR